MHMPDTKTCGGPGGYYWLTAYPAALLYVQAFETLQLLSHMTACCEERAS